MESYSRSRSHAGSIEENTMAIIDAAGAKDTQDSDDDSKCRMSWNLETSSYPFSRQPNGGHFIYHHNFVPYCVCVFLFLVI